MGLSTLQQCRLKHDIAMEIPDPDASKPDDWDDEDDGEWEAPMIDNPDYNGAWSPKMIDNPDYKGPWVHPMIANPEYEYDDNMYAVCKDGCTHVGFELWQVKQFQDGIIGFNQISSKSKESIKSVSKNQNSLCLIAGSLYLAAEVLNIN